jgi:hypothetical protein
VKLYEAIPIERKKKLTGIPLPDRIELWRKRATTNEQGCWLWSGRLNPNGYAHTRIQYRMKYVHRLSYEHYVGPIPEGLGLDHLCRNRSCFNPAHLEPVTALENSRRGVWVPRTHCPAGHPYAGDNLRIRMWNGKPQKYCVVCLKRHRHTSYLRQKEGVSA